MTPQDNPAEHGPDAGFSLVELLVVIVVLGILATVVVFSVRGLVQDSDATACDSERHIVATAVESWFSMNPGADVPATGVGPDRYERTLVEAGFIRAASTMIDLSDDGSLNPAADSPC